MLKWFKEHKKITAAILMVLAQLATLFLPEHKETIDKITMSIGVYLLGQGWADQGKEAAKINAETYPR